MSYKNKIRLLKIKNRKISNFNIKFTKKDPF